ncbi:MAG: zf-HC2 domain-containing protein [Acidimicrobiales bacterium]
MTVEQTWHADADVLAAYVAGRLGRATAASLEAHLLACASCRAGIAPFAPSEQLAGNLAVLHSRIDAPPAPRTERFLQRLGLPERITRLLVVTPSARLAWLIAVAGAMAAAVIAADVSGSSQRATFAFLVGAPLVPLGVVTATFATRSDPAREVVIATPTPGFDLLLVRVVAVLVPAVVLTLLAALVVPGQGGEGALWLLPALGLATATLALASWIPVRAVSGVLGTAWVAAAMVSVRRAPRTDLIEHYIAFRPAGQAVMVAITLAAAAVVVLRRDAFDLIDAGRTQ